MRIISGKYKGVILESAKGIRPTTDKVRKALFDILGDIAGLSFLELFAGSGAVGFEAVSRGIGELVIVEDNRECLKAIRSNIKKLKLNNCKLFPLKVEEALEIIAKKGRTFDIIFLDPPYYKDMAKKTLQMLSCYDIVTPLTLIIVQHFKKDILPNSLETLTLFKEARYSDTCLSFYKEK